MNTKIEDIDKLAKENFKEYVGVLGFGSNFNADRNQIGEKDIDFTVLLGGKLNDTSYNQIKRFQTHLKECSTEFRWNYTHIPFYQFTEEAVIYNAVFVDLFQSGVKKISDETHYDIIAKKFETRRNKSAEHPLLGASREHIMYSRQTMLDDRMYEDEMLKAKIFKNHITTAMRMMLHIEEGNTTIGSFDVWKKWAKQHGESIMIADKYNDLINTLYESSTARIVVHASLVAALGGLENRE
jgi:hypothetical protein